MYNSKCIISKCIFCYEVQSLIYIYPTPPWQAWCGTRSIFKQSLTGIKPRSPGSLANILTTMLIYTYIYIYIYIITIIRHPCSIEYIGSLSHYPFLLSIALGKSPRWHPVSAQNWWMKIFAGRPTLMCPCIGVRKRTSLMNYSLLLQQCPECFACFIWMVCEKEGK